MNIEETQLTNFILNDTDYVNIVNINNAIVNLLSNDLMLFQQSAYTPQTWERKWLLDNSIKGYDRGYCVWYNVDDLQEFTLKNKAIILTYVAKDNRLKEIYEDLNEIEQKNDFLKSIVSGYVNDKIGLKYPSLFELGDLSSPAAIYISLKDNNKDVPTTTSSWTEFVINDDNGNKINNFLKKYANIVMQDHIDNYHLGSTYTSAWLGKFLKKDMSNLKNCQIYSSHQYQLSSDGFDYVRKFVKTKISQPRLINCVVKKYIKQTVWYIGNADLYTQNGVFTDNGATHMKNTMIGCANYLSDNIELTIDNIIGTNNTIIDITYTANKSVNAVPQKTTQRSDIENRISAYNATFKIVPISTMLSDRISADINKYIQKNENTIDYYYSVTYAHNVWFRQWNSGYLEHGGTIKIPENSVSVEVPFNWTYTQNNTVQTAPIYDYPEQNSSMYGSHTMLDYQRNLTYNKARNLKNSRYVVNLTTVNSDYSQFISGDNGSYPFMPNINEVYASNEVVRMTNSSFLFVVEPNTEARYITYYVSGYKTNLER